MKLSPNHIIVTQPIPGLESLDVTYSKCTTLSDLLVAIVARATVPELHVDLAITDALLPLTPVVTVDPTCAPAVSYQWTIKEIASGQSWRFTGAPTTNADNELAVAVGTYAAPLIDWSALAGFLVTYLVKLTVTDGCANIATAVDLVTPATTLKAVMPFTGTDALVTVPPGATKMLVKAWGAGGGSQSNQTNYFGGAGGYSEGIFAVAPNTSFTAVVGRGGLGQGGIGSAYGFGGPNSGDGGQGGGLTGLFIGSANLLETDKNRALIIAGGGGGADYASTRRTRGGNGNDPTYSGGMPTMLGITDNLPGGIANSSASGGGGYQGGAKNTRGSTDPVLLYGGEGGSGYLAPTVLTGTMAYTPEPDRQPPNQSDADYIVGIGVGGASNTLYGHAGHGYMVIVWMK